MRARDFIVEDNADYDEDQYLKSDPGTPLNFPAGTTLVNVSDVYDWYKLGMAISDLDDADPRTFNKGVPHTVFAFGSEEEEHKMIPLLKRLGFSLHDIDSPSDYEKAIRASDAIKSLEEMVEEENKCPPATQDIALNLSNRQKAIDQYGYGPLNPDMPNNKFWMNKVDEWNLDSTQEAKQSLCGNCAAFDIRQETLDCIAQGIDSSNPQDAEGVIAAGDLGYCKFLKFKCASRRTCDAWVTGGPLVDEQGMAENFHDGKNPQDRGDSARHGIAKKSSLNSLDKIVHSKTASPRKKQLAHWQANMRRGRAKKS